MSLKENRTVIKVGTDSLTLPNGYLSLDTMLHLAQEISDAISETRQQIALVSSGAVAAGRMELHGQSPTISHTPQGATKELARKQLLASIGQPQLMARWKEVFRQIRSPHAVGELLTTADTFEHPNEIDNFRAIIENFFLNDFVPILNANDALTTEPLKTGDNDLNAAKIAQHIGASRLILCTNVDGLFDKNPQQHDNANLIEELPVEAISDALIDQFCSGNSTNGTGGMRSKLEVARMLAQYGITTHIIRGSVNHRLSKVIRGEEAIGTIITP